MESRKLSGVTLVELVLYLALFSIIIVVMVQFFLMVVNKNVIAKNMVELSRNSIFIHQTLGYWESKTNSIDYTSSVANSDSGQLYINTSSGLVIFSSVDNDLYIDISGVSHRLNVPNVNVSRFRLEPIINNGSNIGYNVFIDISHGSDSTLVESYEYVFAIN